MNLDVLFQLVRYDVFRLFGVFLLAWTIINFIFYLIERIVWGEAFVHWGDVILVAVLGAAFGLAAYKMGQKIVVNFIKHNDS